MSRIRFPYTPPVPFVSLWELNIRTYVRVNGVPGIYFFTLDTNHRFAAWVARLFFALPYRKTSLNGNLSATRISFEDTNFSLDATIQGQKQKNDFRSWITERYHLFTMKKGKILQGTALHVPWKLKHIRINHLESSFLESFQFRKPQLVDAFAGETLDVKFCPFNKVN